MGRTIFLLENEGSQRACHLRKGGVEIIGIKVKRIKDKMFFM